MLEEKVKDNPKKKLWKKAGIIAAVAGGLTAATYLCAILAPLPVNYNETQIKKEEKKLFQDYTSEVKIRQGVVKYEDLLEHYLDVVKLRNRYLREVSKSLNIPDYVDGIEYYNKNKIVIDRMVVYMELFKPYKNIKCMQPMLENKIFGTKGYKSKIAVYDDAFDLSEQEFISRLRDHELVHAKDLYEGMPSVDNNALKDKERNDFHRNVYVALLELHANENQLEKIIANKTDVSSDFLCDIYMEYVDNYKQLFRFEADNPKLEAEIKKMQIKFFKPWLCNAPHTLVKKNENYHLKWRDKDNKAKLNLESFKRENIDIKLPSELNEQISSFYEDYKMNKNLYLPYDVKEYLMMVFR